MYGFPGGFPVMRNLSADAGHMGSVPGPGRCPRGGNGNPLQYSCLGNPMDGGTGQVIVHGVTEESDRT